MKIWRMKAPGPGIRRHGRDDLTVGARAGSRIQNWVSQEHSAIPPRAETLTPSQGRSVMPATNAEVEAGGRKEIGMAGAQTEARGNSDVFAREGAGGLKKP